MGFWDKQDQTQKLGLQMRIEMCLLMEEWFQFRIHYGILNASYVTLGLEKDTLDNVPVFHAKGYGATTGIAKFFYKVEDYYDSYFSEENGLPLWFIRNINEGGYTKNLEIKFDHKKRVAKINDKKK